MDGYAWAANAFAPEENAGIQRLASASRELHGLNVFRPVQAVGSGKAEDVFAQPADHNGRGVDVSRLYDRRGDDQTAGFRKDWPILGRLESEKLKVFPTPAFF